MKQLVVIGLMAVLVFTVGTNFAFAENQPIPFLKDFDLANKYFKESEKESLKSKILLKQSQSDLEKDVLKKIQDAKKNGTYKRPSESIPVETKPIVCSIGIPPYIIHTKVAHLSCIYPVSVYKLIDDDFKVEEYKSMKLICSNKMYSSLFKKQMGCTMNYEDGSFSYKLS